MCGISGFAAYFLNVFGWVHYFLPGVFVDNRIAYLVNGSLWTVPFELACYLVLGAMVSTGLLRRTRWALLLGLGWLLVSVLLVQFAVTLPGLAGKGVHFLFLQQASKLVPCFLAGSAIYLAQARIPYDWRIAAACAAALLAGSLLLGGPQWFESPLLALLAWGPLAYLVIFLGLSPLPDPPTIHDGDYSYGIYLYHFPLLQVIDHFYRFEHWWQLLLAAALPVLGVAMFSWHVVERPALAFRRRFSLVGARGRRRR